MSAAVNVVRWAFIALLTVAFALPGTPLALLLPGKRRKGALFRFVSKTYSRIILAVMGARVEVRGLGNIDRAAPYIFMANHVSHADSPAVTVALPHPLHWVYKKELGSIPFFGWFLRATGQIMVDRADAGQARQAIGKAVEGLSGNHSVIIYPEGTRSRDGRLQPFKKGGFRMAAESGRPIVPVRVSGTREIIPAGALSIRPGTAVVEVFPPIPTAGKTEADIPGLMRAVREAMESSGTPGP